MADKNLHYVRQVIKTFQTLIACENEIMLSLNGHLFVYFALEF